MKPLFNVSNLLAFSYSEPLPFECERCAKTFYIEAKWIKSAIKRKVNRYQYCTEQCKNESQLTLIDINCAQCQKVFQIKPSQKRKSKTGNNFCSQNCAAKYNNTHKTTGNRRSKLEKWLEGQLSINFPQLTILYNNKATINSELDIYIPSLNIAFELNGIFHYEPIYGSEKLASIQNNDNRKFQACLENKIELVIIDVSSLNYFKPQNAQKYLDIIQQLITQKLGGAGGT